MARACRSQASSQGTRYQGRKIAEAANKLPG
jgi:hypothetical protein